MKYLIFKDTNFLLRTVFPHIQWSYELKRMVIQAENCVHEIKIILVQWCKPPDLWVKLNSNCSSLGNPRLIGGGGIIRNSVGNMLFAYFVPFGGRIK